MIAVSVQNLSKIYRLYQSPTERLKEIILRRPFHTDFAALRNISFAVPRGETFGIIGENGAGKSTLLKILARTLKPTSGDIVINGRTAALLELGAGFNPELSGEENIYLNAYLLGLDKAEIDQKKEAIIDFSELREFIKRPVKTYSSGMYVRLAFSIATCVDPDILIIDEALSVGDEYFQKKCIDRMMDFKKREKTIIFCSHSMYHVQELCNRTAWLDRGEIKMLGETSKVINQYVNYEREKTSAIKGKASDIVKNDTEVEEGKKTIKITDVKLMNKDGIVTEVLRSRDPLEISFKIKCYKDGVKGHIGFAIVRNDEEMCFGTMTNFDNMEPVLFRDGQEFRIKIHSLPLLSGLYSLTIAVADEFALHPYDIRRVATFAVETGGKELGMTFMEHEWII
jgi:ABC-type polysaccharide/polyol phosphate transport system ATPase subunit